MRTQHLTRGVHHMIAPFVSLYHNQAHRNTCRRDDCESSRGKISTVMVQQWIQSRVQKETTAAVRYLAGVSLSAYRYDDEVSAAMCTQAKDDECSTHWQPLTNGTDDGQYSKEFLSEDPWNSADEIA